MIDIMPIRRSLGRISRPVGGLMLIGHEGPVILAMH